MDTNRIGFGCNVGWRGQKAKEVLKMVSRQGLGTFFTAEFFFKNLLETLISMCIPEGGIMLQYTEKR